MPDVYATITKADPAVQERLADVIELRFADPRQQAMLRSYLSEIEFPPEAHVLEIGCGTGAITRTLAQWPAVAQATGIDPSSVFIARARALAQNISNASFEEGDGRSLPFDAAAFDLVVLHTTLCHVPQPERVLAEAWRVLRPRGWIAVFDGDYATATVATGDFDPLQVCVEAFRQNFVNDPWLVRRLPQFLKAGGFEVMPMRSHGYVEAPESGYMLTWIDRGADVLVQTGRVDKAHAKALKAEARRRSATQTWFGQIAFASILGRKPASPR
ncbi:MAG: methyltransferase domain-containing protein [Candidatus Manganitrophus sp. SB1]|nr:methyltransferase domain-containing protein [Candidatus Manganitrophus morganii]